MKNPTLWLAGSLVVLLALSGCQGKPAAKGQPTASLQATSVKVALQSSKTVQESLELNGIIHADQDVQVKAQTQGRITDISADVGAHVTLGQQLAQVDDVVKRATAEANQANLAKLQKDLERTNLLKTQNVSTDTDVDNIKLAVATAQSQATISAKDLADTRIRAPFTGVITEKYVSVGATVAVGTPVFHIISLDDLKITVNVNEKDILKLQPGDKVQVTSTIDPAMVITGKVKAVSPQAASDQNFPVEIAVKNQAEHKLFDGMSVTVKFQFGGRLVKVIPRAALAGSVQTPQVYVVKDKVATLKDIRTGGEYGTDLEVLSGLNDQDLVVVNGQNNLQDGMPVDVIP